MKRFLFAAIALILPATFFAQSNSFAAPSPQLWMLQNCLITPSDPCVKSIRIVKKDGLRIDAKLTGRNAIGEGEAPHDISNEYSIEGMNFESPAQNLLVNRVFYNGSWLQTVVEASWLNTPTNDLSLDLPHRSTNLVCGTSQNPVKCNRNLKFNQEFLVEQEIRLPESFKLSFLNARSDFLRFEKSSNVEVINYLNYYTIKLLFNVTEKQQVLFAPLLPDPLSSSDFADFVIDQTIVNLYSPESRDGQRLGRCSSVPSLSVVSNGINPQTPEWDESTQSISVSIAGPHFKVDGTLNSGFFEARISKSLGECLWNIDLSKKIQAIITILDEGGAPQVQTISSKMDGEEFVLQATNFHYSTPMISIKLKNEPAVPVSSSNPANKKITCVKRQTSKKIVTSNKKCPRGYTLQK